ncbi:MAG: DUF3592 domain-containing protein, partial [Candidatus Sulfotelmatobacter sp.]
VWRARRARWAEHWIPSKGNVVHVKARGGKVEILYTYKFEGGYYSGTENRDFFWSQSAEDYTSRLSEGSPIAIRVAPSDPEQSMISDKDQLEPAGIVWKE